ncbi:MFS transporter [Rhodococcus sp. NPDC056743]|uniref:MFS transporter n=1 Tax=Rhodococcus sp. NPDC056743 TaxID=3345934 RepID=UPI00366DC5FC
MTETAPATSVTVPYRLTYLVLALAITAYSLLQSLVAPVLPLLQQDLNTDRNTVTWVLTAYLLAAAVTTPILGRIGDMIGKKKVLTTVLIIGCAGSVLGALASSITVMIAARAIQGIASGIIPLTFGIIRDEFPRNKVTGAVGVISALLGVGGGLGLVLGGPIVEALNPHWLFWIPAITFGITAIATHLIVPESPNRTPGSVSWIAALLLSSWLIALLVAISEAPKWGWASSSVLGLLVSAAVLAALWMKCELRSNSPLIDMEMMRIPAIWTTNLAALLIGIAMYSIFAFVPAFLQGTPESGYGFNSTITESGLIVLPLSAAFLLAGIGSGPLSHRFGAKSVLVSGSVVASASLLILAFAHSAIWQIMLSMLLMGIGFGLAFSSMSGIIVHAAPSHQTGSASGTNANIRTIGGALGSAMMASVVTAHVLPDGLPAESGYTTGFAMLAVASALGAAAALLIPNKHTPVAVPADASLVDESSTATMSN